MNSFVDVLIKNNKKEMVDVIVKTLDIVDRAKDTSAWTESFVNTLRQLYRGLRDTLGGEKKAATTLVIESPEKQWVTVVMGKVHAALAHADAEGGDAAAFNAAVDAVVKAIDGTDFNQLTQPPSSSSSASALSATPVLPLRRRLVGDSRVAVAAWLGLATFLRTTAGAATTAPARAALLSVCLGRYELFSCPPTMPHLHTSLVQVPSAPCGAAVAGQHR